MSRYRLSLLVVCIAVETSAFAAEGRCFFFDLKNDSIRLARIADYQQDRHESYLRQWLEFADPQHSGQPYGCDEKNWKADFANSTSRVEFTTWEPNSASAAPSEPITPPQKDKAQNASGCITLNDVERAQRALVNTCGYDVEATWCVTSGSHKCSPDNSWTIHPRGKELIMETGDKVWFGACKGPNSIDMANTSSEGVVCK